MSSLTSASWLICFLTLQSVEQTPAVRVESRDHGTILRQVPHPTSRLDVAQAPTPAATVPPITSAEATPGREFFFSWGYNGDSYAKSDLHISQPSLGNDFTFVGVEARDSKGWTDGLFSHSLTV